MYEFSKTCVLFISYYEHLLVNVNECSSNARDVQYSSGEGKFVLSVMCSQVEVSATS